MNKILSSIPIHTKKTAPRMEAVPKSARKSSKHLMQRSKILRDDIIYIIASDVKIL